MLYWRKLQKTGRSRVTTFFKKLFGRKSEEPDPKKEEATIPIIVEQEVEPEDISEEIYFDLPQICVGFGQSVGKVRDHNEDGLFTLTTNLAVNQSYVPLGLYIIADGMGGHKHGELASDLAIRTIVNQVLEKVFISLLAPKSTKPSESIQEIMQDSAQKAHKAIMKDAPGSGTTITAMLILDQQMTIAHAGDSRAYIITPQGRIQALTRDHSLVMRMIELGQLTTEEAAVHPQRNVLYRALGQGDQFMADISTSPLPKTGHILLCSDGLWGVVPEERIISTINQSHDPQTACQILINDANAAGGPDNISAVLIKLPHSD